MPKLMPVTNTRGVRALTLRPGPLLAQVAAIRDPFSGSCGCAADADHGDTGVAVGTSVPSKPRDEESFTVAPPLLLGEPVRDYRCSMFAQRGGA
jgi:hypothetical protein